MPNLLEFSQLGRHSGGLVKKFVFWFLFFIILLTALFFVCWVSLQIPAGESAIVFSKTGGWERALVRAGDFYWRLDNLIPTNITVYSFAPPEVPYSRSVRVNLPDADQVLGPGQAPGLAELSIKVESRFVVTPEGWIARLSPVLGVTPREEFDAARISIIENLAKDFQASIDSSVDSFTTTWLRDSLAVVAAGSQDAVSAGDFAAGLEEHIRKSFPLLEFSAFRTSVTAFPAFSQYSDLWTAWKESSARSTQARLLAEQVRLARETATRAGITLLEAYGEVLQRFPVLIDYFKLAAESGADPLALVNALRELESTATSGLQ